MTAVLRYPPAALRADYARAGIGLALTALPLAALEVNPWIGAFLGAAAGLFAGFALRTAWRQMSRLRLDASGVTVEGPGGRTLRWDELRGMRLRYFSTKRDRSDGWMQLTLRGRSARLAVESTLDGFDVVVARAVEAARANGVVLSPVTIDNLLALGIDVPADPAEGVEDGR